MKELLRNQPHIGIHRFKSSSIYLTRQQGFKCCIPYCDEIHEREQKLAKEAREGKFGASGQASNSSGQVQVKLKNRKNVTEKDPKYIVPWPWDSFSHLLWLKNIQKVFPKFNLNDFKNSEITSKLSINEPRSCGTSTKDAKQKLLSCNYLTIGKVPSNSYGICVDHFDTWPEIYGKKFVLGPVNAGTSTKNWSTIWKLSEGPEYCKLSEYKRKLERLGYDYEVLYDKVPKVLALMPEAEKARKMGSARSAQSTAPHPNIPANRPKLKPKFKNKPRPSELQSSSSSKNLPTQLKPRCSSTPVKKRKNHGFDESIDQHSFFDEILSEEFNILPVKRLKMDVQTNIQIDMTSKGSVNRPELQLGTNGPVFKIHEESALQDENFDLEAEHSNAITKITNLHVSFSVEQESKCSNTTTTNHRRKIRLTKRKRVMSDSSTAIEKLSPLFSTNDKNTQNQVPILAQDSCTDQVKKLRKRSYSDMTDSLTPEANKIRKFLKNTPFLGPGGAGEDMSI